MDRYAMGGPKDTKKLIEFAANVQLDARRTSASKRHSSVGDAYVLGCRGQLGIVAAFAGNVYQLISFRFANLIGQALFKIGRLGVLVEKDKELVVLNGVRSL